MNNVASEYTKLEKLGEGTYGVVYHAQEKLTRRDVALKVSRPELHEEGIPSSSIRECAILRELSHPNVVTVEKIFIENRQCHIVFEFMETDLHKFLKNVFVKKEHLQASWPERVKSFAYQICQAVNHCHCNSILHRDLKPQNILVKDNGTVLKVGDFGLARQVFVPGRTLTHEVVTLWYRPPELLLGTRRYGAALDVWAIGCIMVEMLTLKPLFPGDSEIDQIFKIFKLLGTPNGTRWPAAMSLPNFKASFPKFQPAVWSSAIPALAKEEQFSDLVQKMLKFDPAERITAADALAHPYFSSLTHLKT
jgi:serine/threonine protein kinase